MPGYIVFDPHTSCTQGVGETPEAAWASARDTITMDGVMLLDREEQVDNLSSNTWVLASEYRVLPASDALYNVGLWNDWEEIDGIACTPAEAAAASLLTMRTHVQALTPQSVDGSFLDPAQDGFDGRQKSDQPMEALSGTNDLPLEEHSGPVYPESYRQMVERFRLQQLSLQYKLRRQPYFQETKRRFITVEPVDVLRAAITQARTPTEWARSNGMSPSYIRQVLRRERGVGPKLLKVLNIDRLVVFEMSNRYAKFTDTSERPEIVGVAVKREDYVYWAEVNTGAVWHRILGLGPLGEDLRSVIDELTCYPCSQGLCDFVQAEGPTDRFIEIDGVLCLEKEVSVT